MHLSVFLYSQVGLFFLVKYWSCGICNPPPPPGFWCVVLVYTCYTSVVHLRCFTLPVVCRYPPVDGPDLFYISGCHWRQVVHKTLDRRGRIWGCLKKKMADKSQAVDSTFNNYFEGRLDGHQFIPVISILNIFWP